VHDAAQALAQIAASLRDDFDLTGPWTGAVRRHGKPHPPAAVRCQPTHGIGKADALKAKCDRRSNSGGKSTLSGAEARVAREQDEVALESHAQP
jgi:hypothetical protein